MKAECALLSGANGLWKYPEVMSNTTKNTCFLILKRSSKADMMVISHLLNPIVHSFSLTKSVVSLHSPGDAGLGTMCNWLHSLAISQ